MGFIGLSVFGSRGAGSGAEKWFRVRNCSKEADVHPGQRRRDVLDVGRMVDGGLDAIVRPYRCSARMISAKTTLPRRGSRTF